VLQGGRERITLRLSDGTSIRMPRRWTDADGGAAADGPDETILTVDAVRCMLALIEAFVRR
jgi:hypothetical protein